jgi:hypothetical protein
LHDAFAALRQDHCLPVLQIGDLTASDPKCWRAASRNAVRPAVVGSTGIPKMR